MLGTILTQARYSISGRHLALVCLCVHMISTLIVITRISSRLLYCPQALAGFHSIDHTIETRQTLKHPDLRGCPTVNGTTGTACKITQQSSQPHTTSTQSLYRKVEIIDFVVSCLSVVPPHHIPLIIS